MAHYVPAAEFEQLTGALSKKKIQGVNHMTVTRRKKVKDPLTGEVVGLGPKEIYRQERRDYKEKPLTAPPPCMPARLLPKTKISFGFKEVIYSGVTRSVIIILQGHEMNYISLI